MKKGPACILICLLIVTGFIGVRLLSSFPRPGNDSAWRLRKGMSLREVEDVLGRAADTGYTSEALDGWSYWKNDTETILVWFDDKNTSTKIEWDVRDNELPTVRKSFLDQLME